MLTECVRSNWLPALSVTMKYGTCGTDKALTAAPDTEAGAQDCTHFALSALTLLRHWVESRELLISIISSSLPE